MIPNQENQDGLYSENHEAFANMDIHQFILDTGIDIPPIMRMLYSPYAFCSKGYEVIDKKTIFYLYPLNKKNYIETSKEVGAPAVALGEMVGGSRILVLKSEPDAISEWDMDRNQSMKRYYDYDPKEFVSRLAEAV